MFGIVIAPLYMGPNGRVLSWACYSTRHPQKTPFGDSWRVNRWWRP